MSHLKNKIKTTTYQLITTSVVLRSNPECVTDALSTIFHFSMCDSQKELILFERFDGFLV